MESISALLALCVCVCVCVWGGGGGGGGGYPLVSGGLPSLVQATCAQKPLNRAKLSRGMTLSTISGHHMGTSFRYGTMQQKKQYFYRGRHIYHAITTFLSFGHISTSNWLMITNLVSNTMFLESRISMESSKISFDKCYCGITHVYNKTALYLTHIYIQYVH